MEITKILKGEFSHRVRNCTTERCQGLHGHSYKFELTFEGDPCNQANMVMDFSVMNEFIKPFIDSFDHTHGYCSNEPEDYVKFVQEVCGPRWISAPFNWSCEMMALMIFAYVTRMMNHTDFSNGEKPVLTKVKVWETATGNCQVTARDMLYWSHAWFDKIRFSEAVTKCWPEALQGLLVNKTDDVLVTKQVPQYIAVEHYNDLKEAERYNDF